MTRRLLVMDGTAFPLKEVSGSFGEWDVLPIGIDARALEREHGARLAGLDRYRMLDVSAWADEAAQDVRGFAVPFLHGLAERRGPSGRRLGEILGMPAGNYWWFLGMSEKSPMRGSLIQELYALALVRRAVAEGEYDAICVATSDSLLAGALRTDVEMPPIIHGSRRVNGLGGVHVREWLYWVWALWHLLLLCGLRVVTRFGRWPVSAPPAAVLFFTLYPDWWLGADTSDASDRFFPDMPHDHHGSPLGYAGWITGRPWRLWAQRRQLAEVMRQNGIVPLQRFVPLRAALGLLSPTKFFRLRAFRRACVNSELPLFLHFDVSALVGREVSRSIGAGDLAFIQLLFAGLQRLVDNAPPRALVFRAECQPIERALLYAAQGRVRTIGFWHSALALCDNYLPFHFPAGSYGPRAESGAVAPVPVPDAMLVTGDICSQTLTRQGYPASCVTLCGPIRHRQVLALVRQRPNRQVLRVKLELPLSAVVVFVATSVVRSDVRTMLEAVAESVASLGECVVVLKDHPASALLPAEARALRRALNNTELRVCMSDRQMHEMMAASDIVVTGGSTLAFEAIALGVMPILFENPSAFSATSFRPFERACFVTTNGAQLNDAIAATLSQDDRAVDKRRHWEEIVADVFGDVTVDPGPGFLDALAAAAGLPQHTAPEGGRA